MAGADLFGTAYMEPVILGRLPISEKRLISAVAHKLPDAFCRPVSLLAVLK